MSAKGERLTQFALSLACFVAYVSLFVAVIASAFNASLAQSLSG